MRVLITGRLPIAIYSRIAAMHAVQMNPEDRPMTRAAVDRGIVGAEGLLCTISDTVDAGLMDRAPGLRIIANYGVGYNNIDVAAATARGIPVTNTPDVLTESTADIALALMLSVSRRVVEGDARTRGGGFGYWAPFHFLGTDMSGKTLGIVGFGRIGRAVARRARGFDMTVVYTGRHRADAGTEARLSATFMELPALLETADYVSVHVPLTGATRHLIDAAALSRLKPTAYQINTSRGPVVEETALVEALRGGRIAGAGLDVYENEPNLAPGLADLGNTVLLPHVGSATLETRTKMAELAEANLMAGLSGKRPPNCVNPEVFDRR